MTSLKPEEVKALLEIPTALARLAQLLERNVRATRRLARNHARQGKRYLRANDIARAFGFATKASVWQMPEVLAERIYPTGSSTPMWTQEGLDRAVANMPRKPVTGGKRGMRDAA